MGKIEGISKAFEVNNWSETVDLIAAGDPGKGYVWGRDRG